MPKGNFSSKTQKAIFQINFEHDIEFYDRMRNIPSIAKHFIDWETDSLSVVFKDYKLNHSLSIKFDSIVFDTDNFKTDEIIKVIDLIESEAQPNLFPKKKITRIGYRCLSLLDVSPINFDDLVKILNLKLFNSELFENIGNPSDNTITLVLGSNDNLDCRVTMGPMKKSEVPNYIQINAKNHFYRSDKSRLLEIHKLLDSYPEVCLFIDNDFFSSNPKSIMGFFKQVVTKHTEYEENLKNYLFKKSI